MTTTRYDIMIIGTGAGGGTLLHRLAPSGKRILVIERGEFLPREKENWSTISVFHENRYHTPEVWRHANGKPLHPGTGYWVGGNTKVYGAALFRFRERDFERVVHEGGISPEWPVRYRDFEPYYTQAEHLYRVHGQAGDDPTEPWREGSFPAPAVSHEPRIQEIADGLKRKGYHPFSIPLGIQLNELNPQKSACIRCNTCDGFPCLVDAKSDSDICAVRPALEKSNVTLITGAKVSRLFTTPSGREIDAVEVERDGKHERFSADIVVLSAGAINSAVVLLRSGNDKHPHGLANRSGLVGRNLMKHNNGAIVGLSLKKANPTKFQKTLALNDFYWGEKDFEFPMGHVQLLGKVNKDMMALDAPPIAPGMVLDEMAQHSVDWWLTGEDLATSENRVEVRGNDIVLHYTENNLEGFQRLMSRWGQILKEIDCGHHIVPSHVNFKKRIPLEAVAHQCGTCRFGTDPESSVLDINCRAHDVTNLYVVDGSFFPSSAAVNPSLTIMANALRVGDHLLEELK